MVLKKLKPNEKEELIPPNDFSENLGVFHKVGYKTCNTIANHIGTLVVFNSKKNQNAEILYGPLGFQNGLAEICNKHLVLVHCPSTSKNDVFMLPGDSGGLCYREHGDIIQGVGICIGRIAAHFNQILPLSLIEAVFKVKGYQVRWNTNDANTNEDTVVDDSARIM